ncbi:uncharacterized protein [Lolium perenne]|uniref:uncharacterized protein n=1 Tax=Lolium perenne TaxID=4522 RepID=UPI0021EA2AF0|nr:inactive protein RESTRICTED TEV MOVEMENT 2-like [Lolium perenne]
MAAGRTYVDFVPSHNLVEESTKQTLVLNLPGFQKEHLRVQIDNYGRLRISGERPLEGGQWSRFRKDFQVPDGCDAGGIRARFEKDSVLHITMPRLSPVDLPEDDKHVAEAAAAAAAAEEKKRQEEQEEETRTKRHEEHGSDDDEGGHQEMAASGAGGTAYGFARDRSGMVRRMIIAVALALVGAAGMYARYRLMDPSGETAPAHNATAGLSDY